MLLASGIAQLLHSWAGAGCSGVGSILLEGYNSFFWVLGRKLLTVMGVYAVHPNYTLGESVLVSFGGMHVRFPPEL